MNAYVALAGWLALSPFFVRSAQAVQVTFQVDLSAQIGLGRFQPEADGVFVAGDPLNSWNTSASELTQSGVETNIWAGTFDVDADPGSVVQYKFVLNVASGLIWEGNVGTGGNSGNRTFTLGDGDETLPVVYFDNVTNRTSVRATVTFQVQLDTQVALGTFDRDTGSVTVAGDFNGWNTSAFALTNSPANPDAWTGSTEIQGAADSAASYKFVLNGGVWEGNVGVNGAQNRSLVLKEGEQILPAAYFDNMDNLGSLSLAVAGNEATITWTPGPLIRLQRASSLGVGLWEEVPNTLGQSSVTLPMSGVLQFYRLSGP